jgi:proprotein convertase subtilisin/kexin type 5
MGLQEMGIEMHQDRGSVINSAFEFVYVQYGNDMTDLTFKGVEEATVTASCFAQCPDGTYYVDQWCATCSIENCKACSGPTTCLSCSNGLVPDATLTSCIGKEAESESEDCNCPFHCSTCDCNGHCLTCSNEYFRELKGGLCVPKRGYCETDVPVAAKCPIGCDDCYSPTKCTTCSDGYSMQDGHCVIKSACPPRQFEWYGACPPCPYYCLTCNPTMVCLTCSANVDFRVLSNYRCIPKTGYFESGVQVANKCPPKCSACYALNFCIACNQGYSLTFDAQCV